MPAVFAVGPAFFGGAGRSSVFQLAQVAALRRSRLEKRALGLTDGRFVAIVTERRGRKLLRQGCVRTGQFPPSGKHAGVEQKLAASRWSVHEHNQAVDRSELKTSRSDPKILLPIIRLHYFEYTSGASALKFARTPALRSTLFNLKIQNLRCKSLLSNSLAVGL
jgi:hypothetical protein